MASRLVRATWKGELIAESDDTVVVEGNHYFPLSSVRAELISPSDHTTVCGWKGIANYYHISVGGERNDNAAWFYREPKEAASQIAGRVAFWRGVEVAALD